MGQRLRAERRFRPRPSRRIWPGYSRFGRMSVTSRAAPVDSPAARGTWARVEVEDVGEPRGVRRPHHAVMPNRPEDPRYLLEMLAHMPVFEHGSPEVLAQLVAGTAPTIYSVGNFVCHQGEPAAH